MPERPPNWHSISSGLRWTFLKMLQELRSAREQIEEAIVALERLARRAAGTSIADVHLSE